MRELLEQQVSDYTSHDDSTLAIISLSEICAMWLYNDFQ
jgi:hypothetical protein